MTDLEKIEKQILELENKRDALLKEEKEKLKKERNDRLKEVTEAFLVYDNLYKKFLEDYKNEENDLWELFDYFC